MSLVYELKKLWRKSLQQQQQQQQGAPAPRGGTARQEPQAEPARTGEPQQQQQRQQKQQQQQGEQQGEEQASEGVADRRGEQGENEQQCSSTRTNPPDSSSMVSTSSVAQPQPQPHQPQQQEEARAQQPQQQQKQSTSSSSKPSHADLIKQFSNELRAGEANRYKIKEVIGKGSYGVVCSAVDLYTGEKVAIKKITNVFEHVSDATRILREIKLLRLLKHPDVVEIKHICLPPSSRDFKDIYVVFELMETDLHQVIKANDDLTPEHHQFFLYQMLRGLKYIHSAKVYHRDLKPKNILANSDCKLKICDFGLARPAFDNMPTSVFWTDYVATRWYRAPELCGSFFAKYTAAIDVWSVGCMFAEVLLGKPLFPGKNVVHQLELITDLLGTPPPEVITKVRNEKARRFLSSMKPKPGIPFEEFFPNADPGALAILRRLLAFDPSNRPSAEEALAHPYFKGLHLSSREPSAQPVSKLAFQFDRCKLTMDDVRELIYQEILEYHPHAKSNMKSSFQNPSAVENFKRQFFHLEQNPGMVLEGKSSSKNAPSGLVSCNSNPREIGAEVEPRCISPTFLQSQGSAPGLQSPALPSTQPPEPARKSQPMAPPRAPPAPPPPQRPPQKSHDYLHKTPQLDEEELELLMSLVTDSKPSRDHNKSRTKGQHPPHAYPDRNSNPENAQEAGGAVQGTGMLHGSAATPASQAISSPLPPPIPQMTHTHAHEVHAGEKLLSSGAHHRGAILASGQARP